MLFFFFLLAGYSGVAIYTRTATCAPIRAEEGITGILCAPKKSVKFRHLPEEEQIGGYPRHGQLSGDVDQLELDSEGRCVILEFPGFVLVGVYCPANRDESRDHYRLGFLEALDVRIRNLVAAGKQVVLAGDLNIIRSEMDSTKLADNLRKEGVSLRDWMSMPSRRIFNQLLFEGTVHGARDPGRERAVLWDLCRYFHPGREDMNTCWDTKRNTRPANNGSRIDYILCSDGLKGWFTQADIQPGLMGSDHCPVFATMADKVSVDGGDHALSHLLNLPVMFRYGQRVRAWQPKDALPLSARLMVEFEGRRSIRDMWARRDKATESGLSTSSAAGSTVKTEQRAVAHPSAQEEERRQGVAGGSPMVETRADLDRRTSGTQASLLQGEGLKRGPEAGERTTRAMKRIRAGGEKESMRARAKTTPGQRSIHGFFKPKEKQSEDGGEREGEEVNHVEAASPSSPTAATEGTTEAPVSGDEFLARLQAHESWSRLLAKRPAPCCEHGEPCIRLVTKKAGINCGTSCSPEPDFLFRERAVAGDDAVLRGWDVAVSPGRSFYMCPRPLGPSGAKEKDSEWRCGTFIWSSDWNG